MFSSVLDCPACAHRFHYEHQADQFPESITCPECGNCSSCEDFSALLFCPHCRSKLKVPLNLLHESELMCPRCNGILNDNSVSLNEEDYESTFDGNEHMQSLPRMLQDGEIFDKFRVIRLLGRGGMAEVYQAEHLLLKQLCALKLMRSNGASSDPVFIKRFLREAKLSHSLNHPNIVKVYDVGNDAKTGYFFIAMEYIDGQTLLELSRQGRLPEKTLKTVLYSMGNALQVLADAQVVHRDIKPSNIMLDSNGVFKLMDLGIAKSSGNHTAGEMTLTMEQSTMGTPSYASPEQCHSAHSVDIRSDIYSLGATIYHAASGKLPFDGATAVEIILKVVQEEAVPLKNLRPDLSADFLDLIDRMMKKDPAERPESPGAMINMLASASDGSGRRFKWRQGKSSGKKKDASAKKTGILKKFLISAVLLTIISGNGYFLYKQLKPEFSAKTAVPKVKQDILAGMQPMMSYPDASGEKTLHRKFVNGEKYVYGHAVKFAPIKETHGDVEYDFLKKIPDEGMLPASLIRDGVAHLGGISRPNSSRTDIFWPHGSDSGNCTVELGVQIPEGGENHAILDSFPSLVIRTYQRRLLITSGKLYALIDWELPVGQWVHVTISLDKKKRKMMVFYDNVFWGSYLLDKPFSYQNSWYFSYSGRNQGCKLSYVKIHNRALAIDEWGDLAVPRTYNDPQDVKKSLIVCGMKAKEPAVPAAVEETKSETAVPAVAEKPAAKESNSAVPAVAEKKNVKPARLVLPESLPGTVGKMTLDEQLAYNRKRYDVFEKLHRRDLADTTRKSKSINQANAYRQIQSAREQLLLDWQERLKYLEDRNKKIADAKKKKYDTAAGRRFQMEFRDFTERHRGWGYNADTLQESRRLQHLLSEKNIDPNLSVEDVAQPRCGGPLIVAFAEGRIPRGTDYIPLLLKRWVDPMPLADSGRFYYISQPLIRYGLPDSMLSRSMNTILKRRNMSSQAALRTLQESCQILFFDGLDYTGAHLKEAVLKGDDALVTKMLAAGADPNWRDENGENALFATYYLAKGEHIRNLLLAAGADPEVRNNGGKNARDYAYISDFLINWENGNLEACRKMLDGRVFPDMVMANGQTLLTNACRKMNLPAIKLLIRHSADPNKEDYNRMSPLGEIFEHLHKVKWHNNSSRSSSRKSAEDLDYKNVYEAIRILLNAGADLRKNPRGYGGPGLNFLWRFADRFYDLPESEAMMLFMLKHTRNFTAAHWSSFSRSIETNNKWSLRTKQRIYAAMPPELRRKVK